MCFFKTKHIQHKKKFNTFGTYILHTDIQWQRSIPRISHTLFTASLLVRNPIDLTTIGFCRFFFCLHFDLSIFCALEYLSISFYFLFMQIFPILCKYIQNEFNKPEIMKINSVLLVL